MDCGCRHNIFFCRLSGCFRLTYQLMSYLVTCTDSDSDLDKFCHHLLPMSQVMLKLVGCTHRHAHTCMHARMHPPSHTHTHSHMDRHTDIHAHKPTHTCTSTITYIYMYIFACVHTQIYTHTHTHQLNHMHVDRTA